MKWDGWVFAARKMAEKDSEWSWNGSRLLWAWEFVVWKWKIKKGLTQSVKLLGWQISKASLMELLCLVLCSSSDNFSADPAMCLKNLLKGDVWGCFYAIISNRLSSLTEVLMVVNLTSQVFLYIISEGVTEQNSPPLPVTYYTIGYTAVKDNCKVRGVWKT